MSIASEIRYSLYTDYGESHKLAPMLTHDEILAELKRQFKAGDITQAAVAKHLKIPGPRVSETIAGKRQIQHAEMTPLAEFLGMAGSNVKHAPLGETLFVKGEVAAGVWNEAAEWPETEWQTFTGRSGVNADSEHRFGLLVVGDSMGEIYPHGTLIECVTVFGRAEIKSGKRVVIIRQNIQNEFEATVKEYFEDDEGRPWAIPRSKNPAFRPVRLDEQEDGIVETRIAAVVVSSHRPE